MTHRSDALTKAEIKALSQRSDVVGAALVLHCWGVIIAAMAVFVIWPNPVTFIAAFLIIGSRQLGMAILMHEAAHRTLFKTPKLNDMIGQYLLAAPFGGELHGYRRYHLKHHRYTQTEDDPDLVLSAPFPVTRASMARKLLRDVTGMTAIKQRAGQVVMAFGKSQAFKPSDLIQPAAAQIIIFTVFVLLGFWWLYFALWLLPLLTWFQAVLRVRNIAEHALTELNSDPLRQARTTHAGLLARIFVAPYWVNYHIEHHAFMYVPCYNLPKAHALLRAKGRAAHMVLSPNYADVLRLATSSSPHPA